MEVLGDPRRSRGAGAPGSSGGSGGEGAGPIMVVSLLLRSMSSGFKEEGPSSPGGLGGGSGKIHERSVDVVSGVGSPGGAGGVGAGAPGPSGGLEGACCSGGKEVS